MASYLNLIGATMVAILPLIFGAAIKFDDHSCTVAILPVILGASMVAIVPLIFDATMVPLAEEVRYAHVTFPPHFPTRPYIDPTRNHNYIDTAQPLL